MNKTALLAGAGPAAVLGAALISQYIGGLHPCEMCIWQRWPHGAAIAIAFIAALIRPGRVASALLMAGAAVLLAGSLIGFFHAGVELGYWEGPTGCTGISVKGLSVQDVMKQLQNAPLVRCDQAAWVFLGVSMAGWNGILSAGLAAFWVFLARRHS